ncbi:MAG: GDSL-type esterase/lipase family protein [Methyloligellaceae bacterium]
MRTLSLRSWRWLRSIATVLTSAAALGLAGCLPDVLLDKSAKLETESEDVTASQVNRLRKTSLWSAEGDPLVSSTTGTKQGKEVGKVVTRATSASVQRGSDSTSKAAAANRSQLGNSVAVDVAVHRGLASFFSVLSRLESAALQRPITILHLGDEKLVMDRFSGDLREIFQSRFGDAGRGMMLPGRPFPYLRTRDMQVRQSGRWDVARSLDGVAGPFGLTGVRLTSQAAKASVSSTDLKGPFNWAEVSFLAGPGRGAATVTIADKKGNTVEKQIVDTAADALQSKWLRLNQAGQIIKVTAEDNKPVTLLSWAIGKDRAGIRYVSLGVPGATAGTAQLWDPALVAQEVRQLKPDLIILSYGVNESFDDGLDVTRYESGLSETVSRFKALAPNASLLILGPPDMALLPDHAGRTLSASKSIPCKRLSAEEIKTYSDRIRAHDRQLARWHPPIMLEPVRGVLRRVAARNGAYFWDWSKAMGGSCGIHAWIHRDPPLAAPNHRNLTDLGAKQSALGLFRDLMSGYASYRRLARQQQ